MPKDFRATIINYEDYKRLSTNLPSRNKKIQLNHNQTLISHNLYRIKLEPSLLFFYFFCPVSNKA